ncbi:HMG (high mobility group) box protein [Ceratobasidium sp. AG-Ba]|nr:HMG (high mobility group) box protein [Ceratobasidium sp. AG-Ba]
MSSPTKNESPEPSPVKSESPDMTAMTPNDTTSPAVDPQEPPRSGSPSQVSRRPRNPFILFRTWYIKQGNLKQVTGSFFSCSKITGKLWKAMHDDDRKFWAEQSKLEKEASQGKTYAPAAAPRPRGSRSRKKASMISSARYDPLAVRMPNPIDQRMDNIVQLIIAGKSGEEIGGQLRKRPSVSAAPSTVNIPAAPPLPLVAPVPRSARASVQLDALELQSHLSGSLFDHDSISSSQSPQASLYDLPKTPERLMSGYSTPVEQAPDMCTRTLGQWGDHVLPLNATPDFSHGGSSFHQRSGSLDTSESWSMAGTPGVATTMLQYPVPTEHKMAPQVVYPQGWGYFNVPAPSYGLNYLPTGYDLPNYASQSLVPSTPAWCGPELVSPYDVPGHIPVTHTGDLMWPPEWVNDSY